MTKLTFAELPGAVKIAVGLVWFEGWVLFEEIVVDRQGLWRYMPYYRVGETCVWDLSAFLLIVGSLFLLDRHGRPRPRMPAAGG
jgi:hypothetical protein